MAAMLSRETRLNEEVFTIELPVGKSGSPGLEYKWLQTALEIFDLFCRKQHDYSSNNIAKHGEVGVLVRADDKFERLRTLLLGDDQTAQLPLNEAVKDSWMDMAGMGSLG